MNAKEILGFNPKELLKYTEGECVNISSDNTEIDEIDDKEWLKEFEEDCKIREEYHINNCLKSKQFKMHKPYVYLAGKIEQNGWRELIVGYRCNGLYCGDEIDLNKYYVSFKNKAIITGPWFLACDHGCYHGDNTHGLGINQPGDPEAYGNNYSESEVYNICINQINKSDIVFAYIYDDTCYGSLYEIGYAKKLGKKIVLVFDTKERMSKMWFMCQGADIVEVLDDHQHIGNKFEQIINKISL